ncbi:MAG: alpha/beta hydrolase, partial [Candidatus Rokubacteria bacterium]|nr:alpha/beta hydrolase [Candidatus Rokubacteria bacterium]
VDNWTLIDRITSPTLIVRAERSPVLTPDMAQGLRAGIRGARLVEIPEAYHHLVLDRPQQFVAAVDAFLGEIGLGRTD